MGLKCDECKKNMIIVTEPTEIMVGENRYILSEPITFFKCQICDEDDISAKELKKL